MFRLRDYLRRIVGNSDLNEFSEALDLRNVSINGVPVSFTRVTFSSIRGANLGDASQMDHFLNHVKLEQPDVVALEIGTNDFASWCPEDNGPSPSFWSKDNIDMLLGKLHEFYQVALQFSSVVGICKVIDRRVMIDDIPHDVFTARRDYYNAQLDALAQAEPNMIAFKHADSAICNLREDLSSDGVHLTSDDGLELYKKSIRKLLILLARYALGEGVQVHAKYM